MLAFYRAYLDPVAFSPQPVAKLPAPEKVPQPAAQLETPGKVPHAAAQLPNSILWSVPWFHHVFLMEKVKDLNTRLWYMQQTLANGWSRNVLLTMIQSQVHRRQGKAITNFEMLLPLPQSDLARHSEDLIERTPVSGFHRNWLVTCWFSPVPTRFRVIW